MKTKELLMSAAAFLSFGNIAFAQDMDSAFCKLEFEGLVGEVYSAKEDVNQNVSARAARALLYCEKACNLNAGSGCTRLGQLYDKGLGVKQDHEQAKTYYEKACSINYGEGCARLGRLFGVKQDHEQAKNYYEKACSLSAGMGCAGLGELYAKGLGVKQDYQQAKNYYEKACINHHDSWGCAGLGWLYEDGLGVKIDYYQAETYYKKACREGYDEFDGATGCLKLGYLYSNRGSSGVKSAAKDYLRMACDFGLQDGCKEYRKLKQGY